MSNMNTHKLKPIDRETLLYGILYHATKPMDPLHLQKISFMVDSMLREEYVGKPSSKKTKALLDHQASEYGPFDKSLQTFMDDNKKYIRQTKLKAWNLYRLNTKGGKKANDLLNEIGSDTESIIESVVPYAEEMDEKSLHEYIARRFPDAIKYYKDSRHSTAFNK